MKLKTINQIKQLREQGKTIKEISIELNIATSTIQYNSNEESRKKQIKKQIEYQKTKPTRKWIGRKEYYKKPEIKKRQKEWMAEYYQRNKQAIKKRQKKYGLKFKDKINVKNKERYLKRKGGKKLF